MRRLLLPVIILSLLPFLTSCSGGPGDFSWYGMTVADGVIYLAANEEVVALDVESGAELWTFPPDSDDKPGPFYATPVLLQDLLIVSDVNEGKVYGLERESGVERWSAETSGRIIDGMTPTNGGVAVGNHQGDVYLIEADGSPRLVEADGSPRPFFSAQKGVWTPPLADAETRRLYVASLDHYLYALNLQEGNLGNLLWEFETDGALVGTPALHGDMIYVGAFDRHLYAVDVETGQERWSFETDNWIWGSPLIQGGTIYFGDLSGNVYARNAESGAEVWTFTAESEVRAPPLFSDGVLYVGTGDGNVYALVAETGDQLWKQTVDGVIHSRLAMEGGLLLVSPLKGKAKVIALDPESGAQRWAFPTGD